MAVEGDTRERSANVFSCEQKAKPASPGQNSIRGPISMAGSMSYIEARGVLRAGSKKGVTREREAKKRRTQTKSGQHDTTNEACTRLEGEGTRSQKGTLVSPCVNTNYCVGKVLASRSEPAWGSVPAVFHQKDAHSGLQGYDRGRSWTCNQIFAGPSDSSIANESSTPGRARKRGEGRPRG